MKNITVSVHDALYHRARVRAAERKTTVSALVRYYLTALVEEESEFERLKQEERELRSRLKARGQRFNAADRLSRDTIHSRDALR